MEAVSPGGGSNHVANSQSRADDNDGTTLVGVTSALWENKDRASRAIVHLDFARPHGPEALPVGSPSEKTIAGHQGVGPAAESRIVYGLGSITKGPMGSPLGLSAGGPHQTGLVFGYLPVNGLRILTLGPFRRCFFGSNVIP